MDSIYARGRDNARTPMQWSGGKNAGFTTGEPWLPVNENFVQINAEKALSDPDSIFYYYQKLIQFRKQYPVFRDGDFQLLCPEDPDIFAYTRETDGEKLLIVCNFTPLCRAFALPAEFAQAEILLSNYEKPGSDLPPYGAYILYQKKRKCDK